MNQQQKKYAVKRIGQIFAAHLALVCKQDKETHSKYGTFKLTSEDKYNAIKNGEVNLRKPLSENGSSLDEYYDFSKVITKLKKARGTLLADTHIRQYDRPSIRLSKEFPEHDYINYKSTMQKGEKIIAAYNDACDSIMLGSDEEALAAIQSAENFKV